MLVRPLAWWLNKVPISIGFVLLLAEGGSAGLAFWLLLLGVLGAVCAAANYGYALNELFDVEEDARIGRENVAARLGAPRVWLAAALSALLCLLCGWLAAGGIGLGLAALELCLPAAYSIPPLRIKERTWMGVGSDALAAHVFPAALALAACAHLGVRAPSLALVAASLVWALAAGLRGILSHQLHTAEADRRGGLRTLVGAIGPQRLERFVVFALVPVEAVGFLAIVGLCAPGPLLWIGLAIYAAVEIVKLRDGRFTSAALGPGAAGYVPMLQENLYKAWLPILAAVDAARLDPRFLIVAGLYAAVFFVHLRIEAQRLREVAAALRYPVQGAGRPFQ